jgi:SOS-response transcriptional repressor LexA
VDTELRYLWEGLSVNERRVLAVVASGLSPYTGEAKAVSGLASPSSAQRSVRALQARGILEPADDALSFVDPLLSRWVRRHGGARMTVQVVPGRERGFVVTDGPSLAFTRSEHATLEEAEAEADRIAAGGRAADVMVYDTDDPNDLPDWAIGS